MQSYTHKSGNSPALRIAILCLVVAGISGYGGYKYAWYEMERNLRQLAEQIPQAIGKGFKKAQERAEAQSHREQVKRWQKSVDELPAKIEKSKAIAADWRKHGDETRAKIAEATAKNLEGELRKAREGLRKSGE